GLKSLPNVQKDGLPRMADFARWAMACAPALSIRPEDFLRAYQANRRSANTMVLEASPVAQVVITFMDHKQTWSGTAADLLVELDVVASDAIKRDKTWPTSARKLSEALRRIVPNLRREGIEVTPPGPNDRPRVWQLEQGGDRPSGPSGPSDGAPDQHKRPDGVPDGVGGHTVGTDGGPTGKTAGRDGSDESDGVSLPRSNPCPECGAASADPGYPGHANGCSVFYVGQT
ncbi:MAG: hypothetical protein ACRDHK_15800, partial [Actinomycetota bacterium]